MPSKGTLGCRGTCAPGMNCPPGNLSGEADTYRSRFPSDSSSLLLIFLTKHSAAGLGSSKKPGSAGTTSSQGFGGGKSAGISHFAQAPAESMILMQLAGLQGWLKAQNLQDISPAANHDPVSIWEGKSKQTLSGACPVAHVVPFSSLCPRAPPKGTLPPPARGSPGFDGLQSSSTMVKTKVTARGNCKQVLPTGPGRTGALVTRGWTLYDPSAPAASLGKDFKQAGREYVASRCWPRRRGADLNPTPGTRPAPAPSYLLLQQSRCCLSAGQAQGPGVTKRVCISVPALGRPSRFVLCMYKYRYDNTPLSDWAYSWGQGVQVCSYSIGQVVLLCLSVPVPSPPNKNCNFEGWRRTKIEVLNIRVYVFLLIPITKRSCE